MGEVSLWLTQKLNASMEEYEETSELRDSEDDHDIKNDDKLEGNCSSNCDLYYFKDKAFFLMFEDNDSHCKNIMGGIVEEFSRGVGGYSLNRWVGRCDPGSLIPWFCLRQTSLIFLPCLRQNSDF